MAVRRDRFAAAIEQRDVQPGASLLLLDTVSAFALAAFALGVVRQVVFVAWFVVLGGVEGVVAVLVGLLYLLHLRYLVGARALGPARARLQAGQYGAVLVGWIAAGLVIVLAGSAAVLAGSAAVLAGSSCWPEALPCWPWTRPAACSARSSSSSSSPCAPCVPLAVRRTGLARSKPMTLRRAAAGLALFGRCPFHRALVVLFTVPAAALAGTATLTGPFLLRTVHLPVGVYGLAFVLSGVVGLAGSALAARLLAPGREPRPLTLACLAVGLPAFLLLPFAGGPLPVAVALAVLGTGLPVFFGVIADVALGSVLVTDIPPGRHGPGHGRTPGDRLDHHPVRRPRWRRSR
ncbi:hypothetical protein [Kitasatospora camelliae]|uniref:Integral membrane protein n=1 Tax=Kitasatospora camelliae TaxID=3156397 RepID=A0AAU8JMJ3_9ACTN